MEFNEARYTGIYGYPLNWMAIYDSGEYIKEFITPTIRNEFYDIDQDRVKYFGLYGKGKMFYFDKNGQFHYNRKILNIEYVCDDKVYALTDNEIKKELITFKKAYVDYELGVGITDKVSDGVAVGYKYEYTNEDTTIHTTFILHIPNHAKHKPYLEIKLTANKNLNGTLKFYNEIKEVDSIHAPLAQGYSGKLNWTINL